MFRPICEDPSTFRNFITLLLLLHLKSITVKVLCHRCHLQVEGLGLVSWPELEDVSPPIQKASLILQSDWRVPGISRSPINLET